MIGLLALAWAMVRCRRRGWLYLLGLGLFGLYLLAAVAQMFFPIPLPENWPANLNWSDTLGSLQRINLIPFNYGNMFADVSAGMLHPNVVLWEIGGNILFTVPFGLGISYLKHPLNRKRTLYWALGAGLALEGTQLLLKLMLGVFIHSVDINDVILNGLGVLVGAGLYRAVLWMLRGVRVNLLKVSG